MNASSPHTIHPVNNILLAGPRRVGKTAIRTVLFEQLLLKDVFLDPSTRLERSTLNTVIPLEIWDFPGNISAKAIPVPFSIFKTMIFVIDIRDTYQAAVIKLVEFLVEAYQQHPKMQIEVFLHKAEKHQDDDKRENQAQVEERLHDRLQDVYPEYDMNQINWHFTSVFDYSLHAEFSMVLQKMIPWLPSLEGVMNTFTAQSSSPKAFLFDITSRVHVSTDSSPVDKPALNLCNDYLAMLNSFGPLYRSIKASPRRRNLPSPHLNRDQSLAVLSREPSTSSSSSTSKDLFYPSSATSLSSTGPGMTLTYHLITPALALLAFIPTNFFESRRGLVEFNAVVFRGAIHDMLDELDRIANGD